ncbi:MAG: hypothetical protein ACNA71_07530 [Kiritimatiellia bacterium]
MQHHKPVRKCHGCPLNLGAHCWVFQYPRGQWRGGKDCRLRNDQDVHAAYVQWCNRPTVKSRKMLRREEHRVRSGSLAGEGVVWLRERGLL